MKIILIRHGKTSGNLEGRYVGRTDEPLCEEGIRDLKKANETGFYPKAAKLYTSPMLRCLETGKIIYPNLTALKLDGLRECDFGRFEYKNYMELNGDPDYQAWIDSGGLIGFPEGETLFTFKERQKEAFLSLLYASQDEDTAIICHGGSIMAILEAFALPEKDYFFWQVKNGEGFIASFDSYEFSEGRRCLQIEEKIQLEKY